MTTTPSSTPPPPDPMVRPEQVKASPFYWPNLIAALVASVAIAIGSIGPWAAFMGMTKNAIGGDGNITLVLGIVATLALFALLNFGRTEVRSKRMVALGVVAAVAGVVAFLIALFDAKELSSRTTEIMGSTIGPEIGWGLWMILIGGPVLAVTSVIVVKQVKAIAKDDAAPEAGLDALNPPLTVLAPEPPSEATGPTSYWESPIATPSVPVAATTPEPPPALPVEPPPPLAQMPPLVPVESAAAATPLPPPGQAAGGPPVFDYPMAPTAPPWGTGGSRPSALRRVAPWAGGVAALAAALGTGVWAAPYLTGGSQNTTESGKPAVTKTVTSTAAPSSTVSSTQSTAAAPSPGSGDFGPFDRGDAKVFVDGKPREVRGKVTCFESSDGFLIGIEPPGNQVIIQLSKDLSRVLSVNLGRVNGTSLPSFLDGGARGEASVTNDGKSHRVTGNVPADYAVSGPTLPFDIDVTCP